MPIQDLFVEIDLNPYSKELEAALEKLADRTASLHASTEKLRARNEVFAAYLGEPVRKSRHF